MRIATPEEVVIAIPQGLPVSEVTALAGLVLVAEEYEELCRQLTPPVPRTQAAHRTRHYHLARTHL